METEDILITIQNKIPNIISNFRFMSPLTTSAEEKAVLDKGSLSIERYEENKLTLTFNLPSYLFVEVAPQKEAIEKSLLLKSETVFKYFPGVQVMSVTVVSKPLK